jgi:hypothetical protein
MVEQSQICEPRRRRQSASHLAVQSRQPEWDPSRLKPTGSIAAEVENEMPGDQFADDFKLIEARLASERLGFAGPGEGLPAASLAGPTISRGASA